MVAYLTNLISFFAGLLAQIPVPAPLRDFIIGGFFRFYGAELTEAERPVEQYNSIANYFVRRLRSGLRPIADTTVVSPVDGTLRESLVTGERIHQVKGKSYGLARFLGDAELARRVMGGRYWNMYLAPRNYHHIHSPVTGTITQARLIPGALFPVNDWGLASIEELFCRNERIVTVIEHQQGLLVLVMVGATNVGKMTVEYDPALRGNLLSSRAPISTVYPSPIQIKAGDPLGTFHLGSTVVMFSSPELPSAAIDSGEGVLRPIRFGEPLCKS